MWQWHRRHTYALVESDGDQHRLQEQDLEWFLDDISQPLGDGGVPAFDRSVVTFVAGVLSLLPGSEYCQTGSVGLVTLAFSAMYYLSGILTRRSLAQ